MFEISVGDLRFESDPLSFDLAFVVEPDGLTGWYDSVDVKGNTVARTASHGDFDLPVFRKGRVVTVSGAVIASSEYELLKAGHQLSGLLADGESATVTVQDPSGVTSAVVKLSGAPKFAPHPSGLEASFQVSFKAVDPRKYGVQQSFAGSSVTAHHYGNFPASPVVEVVGPRSAPYTITGPGGRKVTVSQSLTASQTHRIDFASGGVFRNGSRQMGVLTHFQPWTVPPGRRVSMSISSGSMTVLVNDTYM